MSKPFLLLDTNVVSFIFRQDTRADTFIALMKDSVACVSTQTIAECHYGAIRRGWGKTRFDDLKRVLNSYTILGTDKATAEVWGELAVLAEAALLDSEEFERFLQPPDRAMVDARMDQSKACPSGFIGVSLSY